MIYFSPSHASVAGGLGSVHTPATFGHFWGGTPRLLLFWVAQCLPSQHWKPQSVQWLELPSKLPRAPSGGTWSVESEALCSSRALTQGPWEAVRVPAAPAGVVEGHLVDKAEDSMGPREGAEGRGGVSELWLIHMCS